MNLVLRFCLEVGALISLSHFGLRNTDFPWIWVWLFPLVAAVVWGTFNVPGDPSRSGKAPIVVPGKIRLLLEAAFWSVSAICLWFWSHQACLVYIGFLIIHHLLAVPRLKWIWKN